MKILMLIMALMVMALPVQADQSRWDLSEFASIPVLHEGRVKPLDSFARIHLLQIYGADEIKGQNEGHMSAVQWLARALFDPTAESARKIIRIRDDDVKTKFGLDATQKYFSIVDLAPVIMKTQSEVHALITAEEELTKTEQNFLAVHENATALNYLLGSFSLVLPITANIPDGYDIDANQARTYESLAVLRPRLQADLNRIMKRKGQDVAGYSDRERDIALLSFQLEQLSAAAPGNKMFKVFPITEGWASPWQLILEGHGSPENATIMNAWESAALAWRNQDEAAWSASVEELKNSSDHSAIKLFLEILYNAMSPFTLAMGLFGLCLMFCGASELAQRGLTRLKPAPFWPILTLAFGVGVVAAGIIVRIIVLGRPPVSTLYESVLFVTLICGVLGWVFALYSSRKIAIVATALSCLGLLSIAPVLVSGSDDIEVLPAVLNSSFWLGTHVVMVTAGYGACVLAAMLSHGWLIFEKFGARNSGQQNNLMRVIYGTSILALLLTLVGTVLGGIWADQSWGRFWGWDPKENGALLIVLWLIWAQHGRLSKHLNDLYFALSMVALNIIVAVAWFGVNLLNVGLHSYGFTSGLAAGLGVFCLLQLSIIIVLWVLNISKRQHSKGGAR
jgi:ABC-type transport system involved in cytochrome c biogenesis permease subunit